MSSMFRFVSPFASRFIAAAKAADCSFVQAFRRNLVVILVVPFVASCSLVDNFYISNDSSQTVQSNSAATKSGSASSRAASGKKSPSKKLPPANASSHAEQRIPEKRNSIADNSGSDVTALKPDRIFAPQIPSAATRDDIASEAISRRISLKKFRSYPVLSNSGEITALAVSKDGNSSCFGGSDGSVFCGTIITPESKNKQASHAAPELAVRRILPAGRAVLALDFSPNERYLAISRFGLATVIDLRTNEAVATLTQVTGRLESLAWDPRGEFLALGRTSGEVFVWHVFAGTRAGEDSLDAIERYGSQNSPIVRILFHPSARAFFAAEQGGSITLWRLLRTEAELGLFDKTALVDRDRKGTEDVDVGKASGIIDDVILSADSKVLFVATADGVIQRWKVRGLRHLDEIYVGANAAGYIDEFSLPLDGKQFGLLASSGRNQQVVFWCRNLPEDTSFDDAAPVPIFEPKSSDKEDSRIEPQVVEGKLENADEDRAALNAPTLADERKNQKRNQAFLAESEVFLESTGILRIGANSTRLWITQKGGRLTVAEIPQLLDDPRVIRQIKACTP